MRPSHHIHQSRRQLKFATRDITAGDYDAAASSLARATSHAATAVGNHWHLLDGMRATRRRLQYVLTDLAGKGYASYSLTGVLRESYALPDRIQAALTKPPAGHANAAKLAAGDANSDAAHREIIRILRRTRMRARRLLKAIIRAMADEPKPMTIDEAIARAADNRLQGATYSICICHGRRATPCPGPFASRPPPPA